MNNINIWKKGAMVLITMCLAISALAQDLTLNGTVLDENNQPLTGAGVMVKGDKGVIIIENDDIDEDKLMEDALDCGAEDVSIEDEVFEITTAPTDLSAVADALTQKGYTLMSSELSKIPSNYSALSSEEDILMMTRLLESLDDNEDVTNVWHNWENEE